MDDVVKFPGYTFDPYKKADKSMYKGESVGEGGLVRAKPGMYENVAVLDVASQHPTSIIELNLFGEYTQRYKDLLDARIAIKRGNYDEARKMLNGALEPYLKDPNDAKELSYALKIVLNIVYGLTSATFDNPFKDPRNKDNIVAKRGALFMVDLRDYVEAAGFSVVHIKTDSIKIPGATPEIIQAVFEFGQKYGYDFEHEDTYEKFCLVNDAVYIAKKSSGAWEAVGAQFQHPFVFKTLFSGEAVTFSDFGETKQVTKGAMYIDYDHDKPGFLKERGQFIGRTGRFVPVQEGQGGGVLYRIVDDKHYKVTGTSGHLWLEMDRARFEKAEIDMSYFEKLLTAAETTIGKFGEFEEFVR